MTPQTLGGREGSLVAMANTDNRGITTVAQNKGKSNKDGWWFLLPSNFQRSGVPDATIMTGEQMRQSIFGIQDTQDLVLLIGQELRQQKILQHLIRELNQISFLSKSRC